MRFKKGSKVEVFSTKDVSSGAWCPAEIICGNGHNYSIRYDSTTYCTIVERVPRKAIRPCPPQLGGFENCVPGDIIEVLDNFSWKMAKVSKVLGKKQILARLIGSSRELEVSKWDFRVRQSWQDHKWVTIGKGLGNCEDGKRKGDGTLILKFQNSTSRVQQNKETTLHVKDDSFPVAKEINFKESHIDSSRVLKRAASPYCYSRVEAYAGAPNKFRAIEKEVRRYRLIAANPTFHEQVAVASQPETLREKYTNASFNHTTTEFSTINMKRSKITGAVGSSLCRTIESNDGDRLACSVGSCSITSNNSSSASRHVEDTEDHFSDAESFCQWGYDERNGILPTKEELVDEIHRLELLAYRCTIEALHASGPLSWEQEALITNLRRFLHISNDEHLRELRCLISSVASIPIS